MIAPTPRAARGRRPVAALGGGRPPRAIAVLVAAIVLLWQGLAVQAHVHAAAGVSRGAPVARAADRRGSSPDPATCPLCRELAHAGSALTPAAPRLPVASPGVVAAVAPLPGAWTIRLLSHRWQSRGPPPPAKPRS